MLHPCCLRAKGQKRRNCCQMQLADAWKCAEVSSFVVTRYLGLNQEVLVKLELKYFSSESFHCAFEWADYEMLGLHYIPASLPASGCLQHCSIFCLVSVNVQNLIKAIDGKKKLQKPQNPPGCILSKGRQRLHHWHVVRFHFPSVLSKTPERMPMRN